MAETVNKEPEEVIEDLVNQPRNVSTDGGSVTNISVQDAIEADKYLRKKAAGSVNSRGMGVRLGILCGPRHF